MFVIGVGTNIVECHRIHRMIQRHGEHFLGRVYTAREIQNCQSSPQTIERFAGRWAAKEAVLKCLGTGWANGISWLDIEVQSEPGSGLFRVAFGGVARDLAVQLRVQNIHLSVSHCRTYATAYALAVGVERS